MNSNKLIITTDSNGTRTYKVKPLENPMKQVREQLSIERANRDKLFELYDNQRVEFKQKPTKLFKSLKGLGIKIVYHST